MSESIKHTARVSMVAIAAFAAAMIALAPAAHAMPANPEPYEVTQPDGTKVVLRLRGDEHFNWTEDENGYTVVRSNKTYVYGRLDASGHVAPTSYRVGRGNPAQVGLSPGIMPAPDVLRQLKQNRPDNSVGRSAGPALGSGQGPDLGPPPIGTRKNLVVLIRFADHVGRTLPSQSDFNTLFNAVGGDPVLAPTGSVRDYYAENSYGQLTLQSTILDWVTVPQTEAYYANGNSALSYPSRLWDALIYALNAADATVDFNDFDEDNDGFIDGMTFVHSGYAAEFGGVDAYGTNYTNRIWSHKWAIQPTPWTSADGVTVFDYNINPGVWSTSGSAIGRIGVICHETGHFYGLPDLYDTDPTAGEGIGSWGLMANSWGFDGSQHYPPHMCSWSKIQMGWLTPTVISTPGNYALQQFETNAEVYRIDQGFPANEYLLIENRQPVGFEADMPHGGLVVFHIDDLAGYNTQGYPGQTGWPTNGNHYRVAVLQADGFYDLEVGFNRGDSSDVYHAGGTSILGPSTVPSTDTYQGGSVFPTANTFYNISAASSNMTFDYSTEDLNILADITLSDSSLGFAMPTATSADRTLALGNAADSGGETLDYFIQASVEGQEEDTVGSLTFGAAGTVRYRGNIFQVTSATTLKSIESVMDFTGTAQLSFVVYDMPGLASTDVKTRIFELTGPVSGAGLGFYGTGTISVPLQAGRYYGIAVGWNSESITYIWDQNAQPSVSFGNKVAAFSYSGYPLPAAFTGSIGTNVNNYYQRLTVGTSSWLSVDLPLGSVLPQTSQDITVTANATGFAPGTYSGALTIFTNDLDESLVTVPVGLLVGLQNQVYVNFGFAGPEFGTMANPYNTLTESLQAVLPGGNVSILGGGFSPEILDIGQDVNINAVALEATIGASDPSPVPQGESGAFEVRSLAIQPAPGQVRAVNGEPDASSRTASATPVINADREKQPTLRPQQNSGSRTPAR